MTEPRRPMPEPRRVGMPHPAWTLTGGLALFLALLVLLAWQVRAGKDAALAAQQPTAQVAAKPRRVLVRRVIRKVIDKKVVVVHDPAAQVAAAPVGASASSGYSSAPATYSAPASSAPAYSAPAYSAPAPAPAPAPVVTRTS